MSKKLRFNVSAYTAKLIGRENVSNLEGAILELVKNTYDADATKCILYYDKKNDSLYIMDNGTGMTEEIIKKHWMTIGNSSKTNEFISKRGRVQTGAKGIGRFALDRTGDTCVMYTKNQNSNDIIQWKVDWRDFDNKENLTDITAEIDYINGNLYEKVNGNKYLNEMLRKYFKDTGTIFKITNLREEWNSDLIKNIIKNLATLIPPDIENEFAIYFFYEEQKEKEALIISENIDAYDYKIQFSIKDNGKTIIKLDRNEFDFKDKLDEVLKKANFKKEDKEYIMNIIKKVGLEDQLKKFPNELSGGQQQRVAIARALSNKPTVIFADEPTGNLDPETSKEIINVLMRINEEQGTTVLVVTHDQKIVQEHKKRTILMEDGCINADTSLGGYDL